MDMEMNGNMEFNIPGFLSLTPDEEDAPYFEYEEEEELPTWMDDCEVQENLFQILPLTPEESRIDKDNHIVQSNPCYYFFEELGYFTEEPEPIDPTRDYEAEAEQLIQERNRTRQKHIDISSTPSLASSRSGLSSTSSSIHHSEAADPRFPHFSHHNHHHNHHHHHHHHNHHNHHPHNHSNQYPSDTKHILPSNNNNNNHHHRPPLMPPSFHCL